MSQDWKPIALPRFSAVPWLEDSDLRPMGPAEHEVMTGTDEIALGLAVPHPFGREDATLIVRAVRGNGNDGGRIMLAIGEAIAHVVKPKPHITKTAFYPPKPDIEGD